ncbi:MAG: Hpt domain-containing protein [Oscillospiraceae bacterium]|nr:Hpt domain-containing protein [Oscillospiraceae bacterium]
MEKNVSDLFAALNEIGVEVDKTLSRFGDDSSEIYIKFLKRFPDEDRITPIKDAVSENDLEKLSQTAHKLKGVSANLGMTALSESAHVLELKAKNGSVDGADMDIKLIEKLNEEICRIIRENA